MESAGWARSPFTIFLTAILTIPKATSAAAPVITKRTHVSDDACAVYGQPYAETADAAAVAATMATTPESPLKRPMATSIRAAAAKT